MLEKQLIHIHIIVDHKRDQGEIGESKGGDITTIVQVKIIEI